MGELEVRYVHEGSQYEVRPRIVVAADGRESSTRRQLGIELEKTDPRIFLAGMLVDGVRNWPSTDSVIGTSGDAILLVFPQDEDKARLYIGYAIEDKARLAGADKAKTFLEAFRVDAIPIASASSMPDGRDRARPIQCSIPGPMPSWPMASCSPVTQPASATPPSDKACRSHCATRA